MLTHLSDEQKTLAERHHGLIYAFLNKNRLPEETYYDIAVFGYLKGIQAYCENPDLHCYSLATICWKNMKTEVSNFQHKKELPTISMQEKRYSRGEVYSLEELLSRSDDLMEELETEFLLHDLASRLSNQEMEIIHMKMEGQKIYEIAKLKHMRFQAIKQLLDGIYDVVKDTVMG